MGIPQPTQGAACLSLMGQMAQWLSRHWQLWELDSAGVRAPMLSSRQDTNLTLDRSPSAGRGRLLDRWTRLTLPNHLDMATLLFHRTREQALAFKFMLAAAGTPRWSPRQVPCGKLGQAAIRGMPKTASRSLFLVPRASRPPARQDQRWSTEVNLATAIQGVSTPRSSVCPRVDHLDPTSFEVICVSRCNRCPSGAGDRCDLAVGVVDGMTRGPVRGGYERHGCQREGGTLQSLPTACPQSQQAASRGVVLWAEVPHRNAPPLH